MKTFPELLDEGLAGAALDKSDPRDQIKILRAILVALLQIRDNQKTPGPP